MKVKELKKILEGIDENRLVVLSSDGEGNGYDTLHTVDDEMSYEDREVGCEKLTKQMIKDGYTEEDILEGDPCIILYP